MNLAEFTSIGGFIPVEPVRHEVKWKEHRFDVYVKRLSFGDVENLYGSDDPRALLE